MQRYFTLFVWGMLAYLFSFTTSKAQAGGVFPDTLPRLIAQRQFAWEQHMLFSGPLDDTLGYPTEYNGTQYGLPAGRKIMYVLGTSPTRNGSGIAYNFPNGTVLPDSGSIRICANPSRTGIFRDTSKVSVMSAFFANEGIVEGEESILQIFIKYPKEGVGCEVTRFAYPHWQNKRVTLYVELHSQFFLFEGENPRGPQWSRVWVDMTDIFVANGVVTASEDEALPPSFSLSAPFPNPAVRGQDVQMKVEGLEGRRLTAEVVDVLGRSVARIDQVRDEIHFNTSGWASGMYVIRLRDAVTHVSVSKVFVVR